MNQTNEKQVILALYKFIHLPEFETIQKPLLRFCKARHITGTLLLAEEGINGTVCGSRKSIDELLQHLNDHPQIQGIESKESYVDYDKRPFYRMKVKLKKEIVTLGQEGVDPNKKVGTYVSPQEWNQIISDPDVILVDTRNDYEVAIGTFKGAVDPKTTNFREFPDYIKKNLDKKKHKKVAMFCTGGIRCEKASSYMLEEGFDTVYHLKGGILKYLEEIPEDQSMWQGECFVFDNRVAVNHQLQVGSYDMCHACRRPINDEDKKSPHYEHGVSCPYCYSETTEKDKERFEMREKQIQIAKSRNQSHIGLDQSELKKRKTQKKEMQRSQQDG